MDLNVELPKVLAAAAGQLEPHLSNLESSLGQPLEPGSFALGLMTAAFLMQQPALDIVEVAADYPALFDEFLTTCRKREARDLGPYKVGKLLGAYERMAYGQSFPEGTPVRFRAVDAKWTEIVLPDATVRWVLASAVEEL